MPKFREERIRDNMTEKEKMLAGKIYDPSDKTLDKLRVKAHRLSQMYNNTYDTDAEKRKEIMAELVPDCGVNWKSKFQFQ